MSPYRFSVFDELFPVSSFDKTGVGKGLLKFLRQAEGEKLAENGIFLSFCQRFVLPLLNRKL